MMGRGTEGTWCTWAGGGQVLTFPLTSSGSLGEFLSISELSCFLLPQEGGYEHYTTWCVLKKHKTGAQGT